MSNNTQSKNTIRSSKYADGTTTVVNLYDKKPESSVVHSPVRSYSSTTIIDAEPTSTHDILDLEHMAAKMAERKNDGISRHINEAELRQYIMLAEANFEEIAKTDSLLEQAYDLYFTPGLEKKPRLKRKTEKMIARLKSKPHFYCPYEREETTDIHVSRWINKFTSNPEKELLGVTSKDPYEPKRFIVTFEPRVSTSDTNIVLGKRKRERDEGDIVCVNKSSSESRLVCDSVYRPKKARRAR